MGGNIFVFIICLKKFFLGTAKFWEARKMMGALPPNVPRGYEPGLLRK